MDNNFFLSSAIINDNMYWNCVIDGVLEKYDIKTKKLTYVIPVEGLMVDEMDASAVLASDSECIYGVLNCGKYLYQYSAKSNLMKTFFLGLDADRIDLICGAKIVGDCLFVIPKRKDSIYSINIHTGKYETLDLFSTNQYSIDTDNIAETVGDSKYYVINNELRKLKIVDFNHSNDSQMFNYPESIDNIQAFSIKDEMLILIDYKGNLFQWNYNDGKSNNLSVIPREVCGEKDNWHVEMLCTKNTIWFLSSLRDIAIQLDDKNYSVIQELKNNNNINTEYKKYYYSRNINKLINGNKCYFSMINTDSMFIVDTETDQGMFITDISVSVEDKVNFYCSIKRNFFNEGKMMLDEYLYYLNHKDDIAENTVHIKC